MLLRLDHSGARVCFASDGTDLVAGCPSDDEANGSNFYGKIVCTVADAVLTIPETVLESTTDSEDNPGARYGAWFYTSEGERLGPFGQFQRFALPPTPTSTSWPAIEAAQAGS